MTKLCVDCKWYRGVIAPYFGGTERNAPNNMKTSVVNGKRTYTYHFASVIRIGESDCGHEGCWWASK